MRIIPVADHGLETGDMVIQGMSEDLGIEPIRQFSQNTDDGNNRQRHFGRVAV